VPAYASVLRTGGSVTHVERLAARALERGYRQIKLHERDVATVAAARALVGADVPIMLDTNCAWDLAGAIEMARQFEPYDLDWIEEPIYPADDYEAMARLRETTGIPIAAGENLGNLTDMKHMMDAGAVDIAQPDVIRIGISGVWETLHMAEQRGLRGDPHSPYYGPGLIASLHMIAAQREDICAEFFFADLETSPLGDVIYPRDGFFDVPQAPGLGIEVDEKLLQRYRVG
jgi:L-alanine-DL-glutamate epimerase-like enolase superfamily enzyme